MSKVYILSTQSKGDKGMTHQFKVERNEPYNTWAVIELWEDGLVRSPFKTKQEAIDYEREARDYYPDLTLQE